MSFCFALTGQRDPSILIVTNIKSLWDEEIHCVLMPALKHEGRKAQRHGGFIKGFYKMQNCIPGGLVSPCLGVSAICPYETKKYIVVF